MRSAQILLDHGADPLAENHMYATNLALAPALALTLALALARTLARILALTPFLALTLTLTRNAAGASGAHALEESLKVSG